MGSGSSSINSERVLEDLDDRGGRISSWMGSGSSSINSERVREDLDDREGIISS